MALLSVIISADPPAHPHFATLLDGLRSQSTGDMEILVMGSSTLTASSVYFPFQDFPFHLEFCTVSAPGRTAAWNQGAAAAQGKVLLFLDAATIPGPGMISAHMKAQETHGGAAGLGTILPVVPRRLERFSKYLAAKQDRQIAQPGKAIQPADFMAFQNGNLSVPRDAFLRSGGFPTGIPKDHPILAGYHMWAQGLSSVPVPGAFGFNTGKHVHREWLESLERCGAASLKLFMEHPEFLASMPLGCFNEGGLRGILLRRVFLALKLPSISLAGWVSYSSNPAQMDERNRFASAYAYWRGAQQAAAGRDQWERLVSSPLILMYHAVGSGAEPADTYIIPQPRFSRQMAWIKRLGYPVISLEEFLSARLQNQLPPPGAIIITFDDGYRDNLEHACTVLKKYSFPCTIFVVSGSIGDASRWDPGSRLYGRPLLSWQDLRRLQDGQVTIGSHSRSHPDLTVIHRNQLEEELSASRQDLEAGLQKPVGLFAYPNGRKNPVVQQAVEQAGYAAACSSEPGANDAIVPLHSLRRIEVRGTDTMVDFLLALWLRKSRVLWRLWSSQ